MADGEANDSAANDIVELEAMRKDGFSWHPCQVSLCTTGLGLIVLYGNNLEEMITDTQEISARIRVRSTPLQGDDCSSIGQGEHVLATESSHVEGVFYDASVEKAIHVRHSKRIHCRCSFTIKWLHHALPEEAVTVPASAIMKLATKSIHHHPTISAFFGMLEPSNPLDATLCSVMGDERNWEMDIDVLLEQQIKEISTSHGPQENILKDYVSEHKVDLNRQSHGCENEASLKGPLGDKVNGFSGSENKQPAELISETPPAPSPSIQEELSGNRVHLNPLAARAALASLRSEPTMNFSAHSAQRNEKGGMTGQHSDSNLQLGSKFCSFSAVDCSSNAEEDFSLKVSAKIQGESPNLRSIVKKLFPTSSPPHMVEISNLSFGAEIFGTEKKYERGEKQTMLSAEMSLTPSQIQRDNGLHGTSQMSNNNETQSRLTDTRRVTRSRVRGAEKIEAKDCIAAGRDHVLNEFTKLETFPHSAIASRDCLSDNLKIVASLTNGPINRQRVTRSRVRVEKTKVNEYTEAVNFDAKPGTSTKKTSIYSADLEKDVLEKDGMVVNVDTEKGYAIQDAGKHKNPKRLTRSAAREDTENTIVQLKQKLRKNNSIESNVSIERSCIDTPFTSVCTTKNSEQFAEEGESKKICTHVTTKPKSSESSAGSHGGTRQNSESSKKQETRFSPRLRFLPRTRSQNKA